jgi:hypothetical protein
MEEVKLNGLFFSFKKNVTTDLIVLETDYYNYMLVYSCNQYNHFLISEKHVKFYVLIKTRYFDSFRTLVPVISKLKSTKVDLNTVLPLNNTIVCPN